MTRSLLYLLSSIGLLFLVCFTERCGAHPESRAYIPFRTSPWNQPRKNEAPDLREDPQDTRKSAIHKVFEGKDSSMCPLQFSLGISKRLHNTGGPEAAGIRQPPVIYSAFPAQGNGKQVIYSTQYEHLDLLSPATLQTPGETVKEALLQGPDYPLLLESSSFHTSPILYDVNGDGIIDATVCDYDGGIYSIGLAGTPRYFAKTQVPRLYVRRHWVEALVNETLSPEAPKEDGNETVIHDPYHSYFEYYYSSDRNGKPVLQGVTANLLDQDSQQVQAMLERKGQRITHTRHNESTLPSVEPIGSISDATEGDAAKQTTESEEHDHDTQEKEETSLVKEDHVDSTHRRLEELEQEEQEMLKAVDDVVPFIDDVIDRDPEGQIQADPNIENSEETENQVKGDDAYHEPYHYDDYYGKYDEYRDFDDAYGGGYDRAHREYYDDVNYMRLPPHILATPASVEIPKMYSTTDESDFILFVPVSYYFDEDEYEGFFSYTRFDERDHGDETEVQRGSHVASAIMAFVTGDASRWAGQTHLELSTDFTAPENSTLLDAIPLAADSSKMGAFAMASPTVADIDGDGSLEVLIPTSMGMIYAFDARSFFRKDDHWPVQMNHPIEHRILVEDVFGDTNLELLIFDTGGNVVCIRHDTTRLWSRNLVSSLDGLHHLEASSPMTLGDVDGDGYLDVVIFVRIDGRAFVFALDARNGNDLSGFPLELDHVPALTPEMNRLHEKLPQPLLVDLHSDQSHLEAYIRRNGTIWSNKSGEKRIRQQYANYLHGGPGPGLHIVQPVHENLYIIEAATACTQSFPVGDNITAMIQVDDVHGTGRLDLVIPTASGKILTLESATPFHPLNTWSNGELRGLMNAHAHGYSASQGIFVHEVSRQLLDVFGVYMPVTFEIFDNRPGIHVEPDRRKYIISIRDGSSSKRQLFRAEYNAPGVYTERVYIRFGPGFYNINVQMRTSHGIFYHDSFQVGYNVHFMDGFGVLLWLPLVLSAIAILLCGAKKPDWSDESFDDGRGDNNLGILGRAISN